MMDTKVVVCIAIGIAAGALAVYVAPQIVTAFRESRAYRAVLAEESAGVDTPDEAGYVTIPSGE